MNISETTEGSYRDPYEGFSSYIEKGRTSLPFGWESTAYPGGLAINSKSSDVRRMYYEPTVGGFTQVANINITNNTLESLVVFYEGGYPRVTVETSSPEKERHRKYNNLKVRFSTEADTLEFIYNLDEQIPPEVSIFYGKEGHYLLNDFFPTEPSDIKNKKVFLETLLKDGPQTFTAPHPSTPKTLRVKEKKYKASWVNGNRICIQEIGESLKDPGQEEVIYEFTFPLSITKEEVDATINERIADLLSNPRLVPEREEDLQKLDAWRTTDWLHVFDISVIRSRDSVQANETAFKNNLSQAMKG